MKYPIKKPDTEPGCGCSLLALLAALVVFAAVAAIRGCTDPEGATRTLSAQGYKDISITGYRPFGGSDNDWYITGFEATAPNGQHVTGCVTRGVWMKGNTVRLD